MNRPPDSPSPQQPTQEAQRAASNWFDHEDEREFFLGLAADFDRFAAQRVTAAESEIETRFWSIVDRDGLCGVPSDMWNALSRLVMRTAAADKARRDTLAEVEKWHWQRYIELRDESPRSRKGLVSGIAGTHMAAHRESAVYFHTLAPQNPGDAAPESEE